MKQERVFQEEFDMKARITLVSLMFGAVLALGLAVGCQRARTDAQVTSDVQGKLGSDPSVQSRQYTVTAQNGVVTLSGTVNSDNERASAASDAAQVTGVKTVVNNLQVSPPVVAQQAIPVSDPAPAASAEAPRQPAKHRKPSAAGSAREAQPVAEVLPPPPLAPMAEPAAPVVPQPPLPPPPPVAVTIASGTTLSVRLIDAIDSGHNHAGDSFRATLDAPIAVGNETVIPAGADISGKVDDVRDAAHFSGRSEVALELTSLRVNGRSYDLSTDQYARQGTARGKNTGEKMGGGALLGAIIGGIAGGGKGAAIGAGVGAGAGGAAQAATRGQQVHLTSEQVLTFHLQSPLTVTPSGRTERERQSLPH